MFQFTLSLKSACLHAAPSRQPGTLTCRLNLHRGRPLLADCAACEHRAEPPSGSQATAAAIAGGAGGQAVRLHVSPRLRRHAMPVSIDRDAPANGRPVARVQRPAGVREAIVLRNHQCPGDIVALTAAVRDLVRAHAGKYFVQVDTSCKAIWEHNPHVTIVDGPGMYAQGSRVIQCEYPGSPRFPPVSPGIHKSNQRRKT